MTGNSINSKGRKTQQIIIIWFHPNKDHQHVFLQKVTWTKNNFQK
uniref:Uncharacterized protein n=1 Tax=Rhizophora mucronata TaxID=61149 RepID=A0A2P2QRL6_RHIMU